LSIPFRKDSLYPAKRVVIVNKWSFGDDRDSKQSYLKCDLTISVTATLK